MSLILFIYYLREIVFRKGTYKKQIYKNKFQL